MSPARPRGNENLINFNETRPDEAVGHLLSSTAQKKMESRMPKEERQRKVRERTRQQERLANRINIDLPENIKARLIALAKREGVPISQLVAFVLIPALPELEKAENPLWGFRLPSNCSKFMYNLDLEKLQKESGRDAL